MLRNIWVIDNHGVFQMQADLFSFTTSHAARTVGVTVEALRTQYQRTGDFRGIKPTKLPNGRLLWGRSEIMALAGKHLADRKTCIDLRATTPWIESRNLPTADPVAHAFAVALCDPRDDADRHAACHLDDLHALRHWIEAQVKRLTNARDRLTAEQQTDSARLLALSVAAVVASVPDAVMAQAVADYLGGAL
jgi:hypothetical protein